MKPKSYEKCNLTIEQQNMKPSSEILDFTEYENINLHESASEQDAKSYLRIQ